MNDFYVNKQTNKQANKQKSWFLFQRMNELMIMEWLHKEDLFFDSKHDFSMIRLTTVTLSMLVIAFKCKYTQNMLGRQFP